MFTVGVLLITLAACAPGGRPAGPAGPADPTVRAGPPGRSTRAGPPATLVLYDTTGPFAALGELYAIQVANLASHFGGWTAEPVTKYAAGQLASYRLTIYIGSTYDEPIPAAFLDDAAAGGAPVMWLGNNIWQLGKRHPEAVAALGFRADLIDDTPVGQVRYHGTALTRDAANAGGMVRISVTDPARATPLADAVRADGTTVPWAVRSGTFAYVAEIPFTYVSPDDRYLAFSDLLFELLAPQTPVRHRALVRIEDVGPHSDPAQLRAIADYLYQRHVPFSVAVFVEYDDPAGEYSGGRPVRRTLSQAPAVADALRYLTAHGGTLLMHGYTHQYAGGPNPYGVSAEDFEFYRAHIATGDRVVLDGPVPEDSAAWALGRLDAARREWAAARLPAPDIFEFPHYAASADDYRAISARVRARYERVMYFPGALTGGPADHSRSASQFFPYPVRDVYGSPIIPETIGNVAAQRFNQHGVRLPAEMVSSAKSQLVVRDGIASFFYHPFLGLEYLPALVEGIQALGYTFVPAEDAILP